MSKYGELDDVIVMKVSCSFESSAHCFFLNLRFCCCWFEEPSETVQLLRIGALVAPEALVTSHLQPQKMQRSVSLLASFVGQTGKVKRTYHVLGTESCLNSALFEWPHAGGEGSNSKGGFVQRAYSLFYRLSFMLCIALKGHLCRLALLTECFWSFLRKT